MATGSTKIENEEETRRTTLELEADIRQLRDDIAKLTKQLAATGEHSYATAKRVAADSVEQLRQQGETAMQDLRLKASDIEDQITATVREKPVTSLAIAAGVGFILAVLARR